MKMKYLREIIREQLLITEGARLTKYDKKALSYISKLPRGVKIKCPDIRNIQSAEDLLDPWDIFSFVNSKGKSYDPFDSRMRSSKQKKLKLTEKEIENDKDFVFTLETVDLPDGSTPIQVTEIYMPYLAQKAGCAILMYELICELSPDGLVSSRNSVSEYAFNIYKIYKNERKATIQAIPTGTDFAVWSKGAQRKKHDIHWKKKKYTKRTHPLMYRYKAKGTPVYDALLAAGRLHLV
tara:strand:- start:3 stop:713 length:711 start_codon:yes stop_codon:yes gene_type:complete